MAQRLGFRGLVVVAVTTAIIAMATPARGDYSSGASVHIMNAGLDPILVHCSSKDSDLGAYPVAPGANYSWDFSPNIFGMTLYMCEFFWKTFTQKFQVWKGSYYDTRPPCSVTGPCNYRVTPDGFYYGLQGDQSPGNNNNYNNATEGAGAVEHLWAFYQPWLPLNASQLFPH